MIVCPCLESTGWESHPRGDARSAVQIPDYASRCKDSLMKKKYLINDRLHALETEGTGKPVGLRGALEAVRPFAHNGRIGTGEIQ